MPWLHNAYMTVYVISLYNNGIAAHDGLVGHVPLTLLRSV